MGVLSWARYPCIPSKSSHTRTYCSTFVLQSRRRSLAGPQREIVLDNLPVRVHLIIEMSRPALRHGRLNSLFQVALYLPS